MANVEIILYFYTHNRVLHTVNYIHYIKNIWYFNANSVLINHPEQVTLPQYKVYYQIIYSKVNGTPESPKMPTIRFATSIVDHHISLSLSCRFFIVTLRSCFHFLNYCATFYFPKCAQAKRMLFLPIDMNLWCFGSFCFVLKAHKTVHKCFHHLTYYLCSVYPKRRWLRLIKHWR